MKIYDAFISYRRSDGLAIAEELYRYLTARGLRVFFDLCEMVDGHYFTTQIETQLRSAPNYILVATNDVFRFREGEDWVRREIEVALETYEQKPTERSVVVLTQSSVSFPKKESLDSNVRNITDVQRVVSERGSDMADDFERVLNAITQVSRQNLWRAAHRWLENSKRPGGRFASLSIVESLLPNAEQTGGGCDIPVRVSIQPEESGTRALFDAVSESTGHLFLIGQGGIGKTTALMHLMNAAYVDKPYSPDVQIPIFVELSFAPDVYDTLYEDGKSSFIRRSIYKQLRTDRMLRQVTEEEVSDIDEAFMLPYKVAVDPINDILSRTSPAPEYLLLLDGLNEISTAFIGQANSTVAKMIVEEINMLMSRCPNVRIVLTSRSDEATVSDQSITRFYLSGVDESTIQTYLEQCRVADVSKVMQNRALVDTLKIPLFLSLYASLANQGEISTQGEIFRLFFNERRKNISVYTVQNRLDAVERNVYDSAGMNQRSRLTAQMQYFILDFLLPEIAWHMERNGLFYLRPNQIAQIIRPVLEDCSDTAVCGDFGKEVFTKFQQGSAADIHTQKTAEDILERLGPNISKCTEKIINCCTLALGILQNSGRRYGFIHQHIRDYFAAVKHINTLRMAVFMQEEGEEDLALACMNAAFKDEPVSLSVRRFLGETLGEHQNKPIFRNGAYHSSVDTSQEDRTLLSRALVIYRDKFRGEGGYGQFTLLKTLTEVRGSLAGCDLSRLDLTGFNLNGTGLGKIGLAANLHGAKIWEENLFFTGLADICRYFDITSDGGRILTGTDQDVKIWDAKTGSLLKSFVGFNEIRQASFIGDDHLLLVICPLSGYGVSLRIVELSIGEWRTVEQPLLSVINIEISRNKKYLLLVADQGEDIAGDDCRYKLDVLSIPELKTVFRYEYEEDTKSPAAYFADHSKEIVVLYSKWNNREEAVGGDLPPDSQAYDSFLETWDFQQGIKVRSLQLKEQNIAAEAVAVRHNIVAHAGNDWDGEGSKLILLDTISGATVKTIPLPESRHIDLQYSSTGNILSVRTAAGFLLFDTSDYHLERVINQSVHFLFFGPEDRTVALSEVDGGVSIYEFPLFMLKTKIPGTTNWSKRDIVTFSADSMGIAVLSGTGDLRMWDAKSLVLLDERKVPHRIRGKLACSGDGKYLYCHYSRWSYIYSADDLQCVYSKAGDLEFCSDGKYLASLQRMDSVLLDPADFHTIRVLEKAGVCGFYDDTVVVRNYTGEMTDLMKDMVYCPVFRSISILSIHTGELLAKLETTSGERLKTVAVNRQYIAAASEKNIYVWNQGTYRLKGVYPFQPKQEINSFEFSSDGRFLIACCGFHSSYNVIWETEHFEIVMQKESRLSSQLRSSPTGKLIMERCAQKPGKYQFNIYTSDSMECLGVVPIASNSNEAYAVSSDDSRLVILERGNMYVYHMENPTDTKENFRVNLAARIPLEPGIEVKGLDLRNLHPDSRISEEHRKTLRYYGAIVD